MKCTFCGYIFNESENRRGCTGCPLSKSCQKIRCPNCGFEMPKETGLIKLIRKWKSKKPAK